MNNTTRNGCPAYISSIPAEQKIYFAYLFSVNAVIATTFNLLIIAAFFAKQYLRKWNYFLIFSLAVGDLLVGCVLSPISTYLMRRQLENCLLDTIYKYLSGIVSPAFYTICAIAYHRYLRIKGLSQGRLTKKLFFFCFVLPWISPLFLIVFRYGGKRTLFISALVMFLFSYLMSLIFYAKVCYVLKKEHERITTTSPELLAKIKSNKSAVHFILLLITVYVLSTVGTMTFLIVRLCNDISPNPTNSLTKNDENLFIVINQLLFQVNSSINPIIYFCKIKKLRKALHQMLFGNRVDESR